jgi:hypothetical protein
MSAKLKVGINAACRIVDFNALRLNDAVAKGFYRCAPETVGGSERLLDQDAMLPLYFFARMLDCKLSARWCGAIACDIAEHVVAAEAKGTPVDNIVLLIGERNPVAFGGSHPTYVKWMSDGGYVNDADIDVGPVVMRLTFEIKTVRAIIADMMQHEIKKFLAANPGAL